MAAARVRITPHRRAPHFNYSRSAGVFMLENLTQKILKNFLKGLDNYYN